MASAFPAYGYRAVILAGSMPRSGSPAGFRQPRRGHQAGASAIGALTSARWVRVNPVSAGSGGTRPARSRPMHRPAPRLLMRTSTRFRRTAAQHGSAWVGRTGLQPCGFPVRTQFRLPFPPERIAQDGPPGTLTHGGQAGSPGMRQRGPVHIFFGGLPEPGFPFALRAARRVIRECKRTVHICWEWNTPGLPAWPHGSPLRAVVR